MEAFSLELPCMHAPFQSGRILPDKEQHPGIKVPLTIHDLNALHEGKSLKAQHRNIAHTQSLINRSDAIVCISEFTKSDVTKHCDTGSKSAYVIHNGVHKVSTPGAAPVSVFKEGMQRFARENMSALIIQLRKLFSWTESAAKY